MYVIAYVPFWQHFYMYLCDFKSMDTNISIILSVKKPMVSFQLYIKKNTR